MAGRRLPSWLIEEYLAVLFGDEEVDPEVRQRAAIEHHAELNFRVHGGGRCGICHSHVRHVVQVTVTKGDEVHVYRCLCTRCLEGERSSSERVTLTLGRSTVTYQPRTSDVPVRRWDDARTSVCCEEPGGEGLTRSRCAKD